MNAVGTLKYLIAIIILASAFATISAIFSHDGPGTYQHRSIRGHEVTIYGKGLYKDMSAEVAPQGLAQDHVTLLIGIPLLVLSFLMSRKGSLRGRFLMAGTLGYFLVTYLFYLTMGMYNAMYLVYVISLSASFFAFILTISSFPGNLTSAFQPRESMGITGGFLIFTSIAIALLWLSIIIPPLLDGTIVPRQTEHYTTLIVQGLDLAILLPCAFLSGILFIRKKPAGFLFAPVYLVFLSLLMAALTAKVIAMAILDYNVVPVIYLIPTFFILSVLCSIDVLRNINEANMRVSED